jgi:hypothetical protein
MKYPPSSPYYGPTAAERAAMRLADAAPDLLAALEEMLNQFGHYCEHTEDAAEIAAQAKARAAIAKAKGTA